VVSEYRKKSRRLGSMSNQSESSWIDLAVKSIALFANDGKLDRSEVEGLVRKALADGKIDEDERRVLRKIFEKAVPESVTPDGAAAIERARLQLKI
jgi:uncharacterized membrane protein YebE (DUF533 family)